MVESGGRCGLPKKSYLMSAVIGAGVVSRKPKVTDADATATAAGPTKLGGTSTSKPVESPLRFLTEWAAPDMRAQKRDL
jgi:hypothetical protein